MRIIHPKIKKARKVYKLQVIKPDPVYNNVLASKFINCIMKKGKKSTAEKVFYDALTEVRKRVNDAEPFDVFKTAIDNVKPVVEVKSRRVGGATYQVPVEVNTKRQQSLAIRWILEGARSQKGKPMALKLAAEFVDAYNKRGSAITLRENTHKMAEANRAFAHFAW